jgi:hypothetical protein
MAHEVAMGIEELTSAYTEVCASLFQYRRKEIKDGGNHTQCRTDSASSVDRAGLFLVHVWYIVCAFVVKSRPQLLKSSLGSVLMSWARGSIHRSGRRHGYWTRYSWSSLVDVITCCRAP